MTDCQFRKIVASPPVKIARLGGPNKLGAGNEGDVGVGPARVAVGERVGVDVRAPRRVGVGENGRVGGGVNVAVGSSVGVGGSGVACT